MNDRGDLYNKIGIALLIVLAFIYFPPKLVAGAVLIFAGLFCLVWMLLILPDEVATDYDNQFEPPTWVDSWEEYRQMSSQGKPDNPEKQGKQEYKTTGTEPGLDEYGGRIFDEVAGTIEWDVTKRINQKQQ